jgi:adenylyl-sulfate kinase
MSTAPEALHGPCVVWFTGLSGAGKTTIARLVEQELAERGCKVFVLDGDLVRQGLSSDLRFSEADRTENLRRAAEVAALLADAGFIMLAAFITPREFDRQRIRLTLARHVIIEAFVDTPLHVAEKRDVKGLYRKARGGEIASFTGVSAAFEVPNAPDLRLDTTTCPAEGLAAQVVDALAAQRVIEPSR